MKEVYMIMQEYLIVNTDTLTVQRKMEKENTPLTTPCKEARDIPEDEWAGLFSRIAVSIFHERQDLDMGITQYDRECGNSPSSGITRFSRLPVPKYLGETDYRLKLLEVIRDNLYRAFAEKDQPRKKIVVHDPPPEPPKEPSDDKKS
jgi:hypothetical protein